MTPEQKIIAIAEWEGWDFIKLGKDSLKILHPSKTLNDVISIQLNGRTLEEAKLDYISALPPYLTSRDAICGAVAKLDESDLANFADHLQNVCGHYCVGVIPDYRRHLTSLSRLVLSTPTQLADALLLTLGYEI